MTDPSRIEDLRRRVQKDPASIAFAQLAEEYRRASRYAEAVSICQTGLDLHPSYLSARVTLGRSLLQLGQLDLAQQELELVLRSAADNLAALRGLAEIHRKRGALDLALTYSQQALEIAPNDPELEQGVEELEALAEQQPVPSEDRRERALLAVLEQWLAAIHVARAHRTA